MSKFQFILTCVGLGACVSLSACGPGGESTRELARDTPLRTRPALDSAALLSATHAVRQFLDASREGSATRDSLEALTACGDTGGDSYFPTSLLAGYSLMPFDMRGDTVIARASVVTVAEQDVDRRTSSFTARIRVREDELEWDVIPTGEPGRWVVCNGLRFGYFGADNLTNWRPEGASYAAALALVDSIVKARGN